MENAKEAQVNRNQFKEKHVPNETERGRKAGATTGATRKAQDSCA